MKFQKFEENDYFSVVCLLASMAFVSAAAAAAAAAAVNHCNPEPRLRHRQKTKKQKTCACSCKVPAVSCYYTSNFLRPNI